MTTQVSEETQEIRALAREFAAAELRPGAEERDRERRLPPELLAQIGELGFLGMRVPEANGGMGFGLPAYVAAMEELAWGDASAAVALAASSFAAELIVAHGSDAQKSQWLEQLASGAAIGCFAVTEEGAGDDVSGLNTRAAQRDGGWALSGTKTWVSNAGQAQLAVVLARTDGTDKNADTGLFLVPLDAGGVTWGERETTMGLRALDVRPLRLDDVAVPAEARLGATRAGAELLAESLPAGRMGIAAIAVGIARAALEHARDYAAQREQFGRPIRSFEAMQFKLADMTTRVDAARALLAEAAAHADAVAAAKAKLFASETAMWVTTQAVQIYGGYGYMRDYPVEKLMRDAKATELLEGASDALRVEIAAGLYE